MFKFVSSFFILILVVNNSFADYRIEIRNNISKDIGLTGFVSSYLDMVSPEGLFNAIAVDSPLPYRSNYVSSRNHSADEIRFGISSGIDWRYVCLDINGNQTADPSCYDSWNNLAPNKQFLFPTDFVGCDINLAEPDFVIDTSDKIINGELFETRLVRFIFRSNMTIRYSVNRTDLNGNRDTTRGDLVSASDNCYPYAS